MPDSESPGCWIDSLLAGVPHILYGLIVVVPIISQGRLSLGSVWRLPALSFVAILAIALVFSLERPWPRWAGTLVGYGMVVALRLPLYSSDTILLNDVALVALIGWLLVVVAVSLWLVGRDRLSGLLAALALAPMLWSRLGLAEVSPSVTIPLYIVVSILTAAAAASIVNMRKKWNGVWLGLGLNLLVSILVTLAVMFASPSPGLGSLLPQAPIPLVVLISFLIRMAVSSLVITGPLWGWSLWDQGRRLFARG